MLYVFLSLCNVTADGMMLTQICGMLKPQNLTTIMLCYNDFMFVRIILFNNPNYRSYYYQSCFETDIYILCADQQWMFCVAICLDKKEKIEKREKKTQTNLPQIKEDRFVHYCFDNQVEN